MNELKLQEDEEGEDEDDKRSGSMLPTLDLNFVASCFFPVIFLALFCFVADELEPRLALGLMTGVDRRPKPNCRH